MRLPKLTAAECVSLFTDHGAAAARFVESQIGVEAQHALHPKALKTPVARAVGVEKSYSGQCCQRDPHSGKFLDCCYGQCRVVDSC